uniref:Neurotoxin homolog NL1 n=1 Tax=Naja atra TaxID=8656 RepID=3SO8_NAJAT|nr:RecName: Full=Neurotoxin homolog NL1; Flags: Precursor [Naja atra]CAC08183.1 unnamed protein product [Naja atra]
MKTLLLTLVVVTMVCMDLGYTTICYNHLSRTPETTEICPDSWYFCYKISLADGNDVRIKRGCTFTCPELRPTGKYVYCCRRDKCNQ